MKNTTDSCVKISMSKILTALKEDYKNTDWNIEFRYFMTVAVVPSTVIIAILFIFNDDDPFIMGSILGWLFWLIYTSCGTTHESRKKNINDILWCVDPYMFPSLPSLARQNLLIKYSLNRNEFTLFSIIQRLHLIFGVFFMFVLIDVALMIQYPHLDADQFIGLYFIGGIGALSFFAGGYFEDMKLHYIKIYPEAKIFLWKYTFYVFLYSLIGMFILCLPVIYLIRIILQPT